VASAEDAGHVDVVGSVGVDRAGPCGADVGDGLVAHLGAVGVLRVDGVLDVPVVDSTQMLTTRVRQWAWAVWSSCWRYFSFGVGEGDETPQVVGLTFPSVA
jgi:hypothetical protein